MYHQTLRRDKSREPSYPVTEETTLLPFLLATLKDKSRNNVKSLLSRKLVAVDGRPTSQFDSPLKPGQTVTILSVPAPMNGALPFPVLFEDEHLVVINKPAGLLSISNGKEKERTAYHMVTDYVKSRNIDSRIFSIHRLDKDTSGVLMFAKDEKTKQAFQEHWADCVTKRGYYALVEGTPKVPEDTIRSYLIETSTHLVFSGDPGPGAQEAVTHYSVVRSGGGYSLLDVSIDTGRKNQIRVHMKDIGHPVVGDKKYGAKSNPIGRLGLHAYELSFRHPLTGKEVSFVARVPKEFNRLMK